MPNTNDTNGSAKTWIVHLRETMKELIGELKTTNSNLENLHRDFEVEKKENQLRREAIDERCHKMESKIEKIETAHRECSSTVKDKLGILESSREGWIKFFNNPLIQKIVFVLFMVIMILFMNHLGNRGALSPEEVKAIKSVTYPGPMQPPTPSP